MEQHDQERSWKSDPRLHLHRKMRQSNLVFSSEERDLLFSILTENLSPDGRKKAEMIRRLAGQFPPK